MARYSKSQIVLSLLEAGVELTRANTYMLYGVSDIFPIIKKLEAEGYKIKRRKLSNAEVGYSLDKTK